MKKNLLIALFTLLIIWNLFLTFSLVNKQDSNSDINKPVINNYNVTGFSTDFTKIVEEEKSSVVSIESPKGISSGLIYKQDGDDIYILTTFHSVSDETNIHIVFDSLYRKEAEVIGQDIYSDLAILHATLPYEVKTIKLGDSLLLKDGEYLLSIGTPNSLEYRNTVEVTMVSSALRFLENEIIFDEVTSSYYSPLIQLSDALKPGNSGSPLFNMAGEVVGICLMEDENGIDFALPINEARIIAEKIINNEEYDHHLLNFRGEFINNMPNYEKNNLAISIEITNGFYINRIKDNSSAFNMGLRIGDIITAINGITIEDYDDLLNIIYNEETINNINIYRANEEILLERNAND